MTKKEYVEYWRKAAEKDWIAVGHLFEKGDNLHALFFAHLVLEKLLKSHWVKDNLKDFPPKTHNLPYLASQTSVDLTQSQIEFLEKMNDFQIDGRYPDFELKMFEMCTDSFTQFVLDDVKILMAWLQKHLY